MKKYIVSLLIITCLLSVKLHAETPDENEFTWAKYEMACYQYGVEPSWEQYEQLCLNPQGYGDEDGSEMERIIKEANK